MWLMSLSVITPSPTGYVDFVSPSTNKDPLALRQLIKNGPFQGARGVSQYDNIHDCYEYGDCIDVSNTENEFYIFRTNYFIRNFTIVVDELLRQIDVKLNVSSATQHHHNDATRYTPLEMCWPTDYDVAGENGQRFVRKMYKAYVLSDQAKQSTYLLLRFADETIYKLTKIYAALLNRTASLVLRFVMPSAINIVDTNDVAEQTIAARQAITESHPYIANCPSTSHFDRFGYSSTNDRNFDTTMYDVKCYRSGDCIDVANRVNDVYLNKWICVFNNVSVTINATLSSIERLLRIPPRHASFAPFSVVSLCINKPPSAYNALFALKTNMAYQLSNKANLVFYEVQNLILDVVHRLTTINGSLT